MLKLLFTTLLCSADDFVSSMGQKSVLHFSIQPWKFKFKFKFVVCCDGLIQGPKFPCKAKQNKQTNKNNNNRQGWIQDFLKEGAPTLRVYRTLAPVGTGGVCAPSEAKKNCNLQSQFTQFGAFFLPWGTHTKSGALSLQKIEGAHARCAPL